MMGPGQGDNLLQIWPFLVSTLHGTTSSHLKMDDWKTKNIRKQW